MRPLHTLLLRVHDGAANVCGRRDNADHHIAFLMDPEGPFTASDVETQENQARKGAPLPYKEPPAGLSPDHRQENNK
ncbi:hypothetical protein [Bogoriella caseilytica]|uniref:hypothetical protein n=1 Tax=Bogoriella caseilytica TaxID=56055 RepID=UPI000F4ACB1A|nr:hypothetical protein [Bogoriella caseilytica]